MYGKSARRSSLFLLELMIAILMFSVASAWCVRLFVTARSVVSETEEQNRAQNLVAGYAELFLASGDFDAFLLDEGAEKETETGAALYHLGYDENWMACREADASFVLDIRVTEKEGFAKCVLRFHRPDGESSVYDLEVEKYIGGEEAL